MEKYWANGLINKHFKKKTQNIPRNLEDCAHLSAIRPELFPLADSEIQHGEEMDL